MENINLIRKVAWSFHYTTGLDWDDLFQEAAYAYLEGIKSHNPKKGTISTHMWVCMSNHLRNYIKEQEYYNCTSPFEEGYDFPTDSNDFFDRLTEDAQTVARMVLSSSKKFVVLDKEEAEDRLVRILAKQRWPAERICQAILNLEQAFE